MFPSDLLHRVATGLLEVADAMLAPSAELEQRPDGHRDRPDEHTGRPRPRATGAAASRRPGSSPAQVQPCVSPVAPRTERAWRRRAPDRADLGSESGMP